MFTNARTRLSSALILSSVSLLAACGAETKVADDTPDLASNKPAEGSKDPEASNPTPATVSKAPEAVSPAPQATAPQALYLADAGKRPVCDEMNEGQLVYLVSAKEMQACQAGQWEVVDLRGAQGEAGRDGKDGLSSAVVSRQYCSKAVAESLYIRSTVSVMANGDVHSTCEVSDSLRSTQSASLLSALTGSVISGQNGCTVTYDADGTATSGWWNFVTVNGVRQATYRDVGSAADGNVYQFAAEECTKTVY
jgi:hypothetical protein